VNDLDRARLKREGLAVTPKTEMLADELVSLPGSCPTCHEPLDAHNTAQIIRCAAARPKQGA
jgi:hypothetical protein